MLTIWLGLKVQKEWWTTYPYFQSKHTVSSSKMAALLSLGHSTFSYIVEQGYKDKIGAVRWFSTSATETPTRALKQHRNETRWDRCVHRFVRQRIVTRDVCVNKDPTCHGIIKTRWAVIDDILLPEFKLDQHMHQTPCGIFRLTQWTNPFRDRSYEKKSGAKRMNQHDVVNIPVCSVLLCSS